MKEFMLLIRNEIDHQALWSPEQHQQFLKRCEDYIGILTKEGENNIGPAACKGRQDHIRFKRCMEGRAFQ